MEYSSDDSDISYSEIDDYEVKSYSRLKDGKLKVKYTDSSYRCPFCVGKKKQDYQYKDLLQHATDLDRSNRSGKVKANHRALANLLKNDLSNADGSSKMVIEQEPRNPKKDNHFVWPWMGILVTAPIKNKNGQFVGESGTKMKEQLFQFNPLKVHALWSFNGHSGNLIVDFSKDRTGFNDAMAFEKFFEAKHLGKRDWSGRRHHGSDMYGWVARYDDYHSRGLIGEHLRKNGDLKTINDLEKEESRKAEKLVANLESQIEVKSKEFQQSECMYNTTSMSLDKVMEDRDMMLHAHNEEIRELRHRIIKDNEKLRLEMERKLNKKIEELKKERDEKIEDFAVLEDTCNALIIKEHLINNELEEVRKALILGLQGTQSGHTSTAVIGIRKMGELDGKPFQNVCNQRYPKDEADVKAAEFISKWQEEIKKADWHPYKRIKVDGNDKEVIDEDDERLHGLKIELGDEAYLAVTTALLEINEYNPSGRYVIHELWNFKEKKKALPGEVVQYVFKQLKRRKR